VPPESGNAARLPGATQWQRFFVGTLRTWRLRVACRRSTAALAQLQCRFDPALRCARYRVHTPRTELLCTSPTRWRRRYRA